MRRALVVTTCGLLLGLALPLTSALAQEATDDQPTPDIDESTAQPQAVPAQLRIESVELDGYPEVGFTVNVTTSSSGPLPAGAFRVLEDGVERPAAITYTGATDLQVMLLIDTTGSMGGPPMVAAKGAATAFVGSLPDDVDLAVVGYDLDATVVSDFSATREEHLAGIDSLSADGSTALYDAVLAGVDTFPDDPDASQVIVLLTDGEDNESDSSVEDAVDALTAADVTLHSVEYLTAYTEGGGIRTMANATGGAMLRADDAHALTAVYEQLAADLAGRYRISYVSEATGGVELDVQVDHEGVKAAGRRTLALPTATSAPSEGTETETETAAPVLATPTTIPPSKVSTFARVGMVVGVALWSLALAISALVFLLPRERRAQLAGMVSSRSRRHASGMTGLADRATLVAERSLERRGYRGGVNAALERASIDLRPGEFVVLVGSAAFTAGVVGHLLQGWLLALLLPLVAVVVARLVVSFLAGRRQARFADQLGETLQLLSGSLRAGYSLMQAVNSVAREADSPSAEEFSRLVVETRLGRDMHEALAAMADRMQSDDFEWVMQAIEIHREVGGDLAEVLDNVAATIRERNQIRRQVKALSAEGKLSAYILLALPFAVGGLLAASNPSYLAELTNGGLLGWGMIGFGAVLMITGIIWMRNLVKFRF